MYHQPSDLEPDEITEEFLRRLSSNLGTDWEKLATFLDISYATVGKLKRDHTGTEEQIFQMLLTFKKNSNKNQHGLVDQLETALSDIGRVDLACNIRRELEQKKQRRDDSQSQQGKPSQPNEEVFPDLDLPTYNDSLEGSDDLFSSYSL